MTVAQERAKKLEQELSELMLLINHDDFASLYEGDVEETKTLLKEHMITLRADMRQLSEVDAASFFPGNPIFDNANRLLIRDVESVGVDIEFEIIPQLEIVAKQLAEKAKEIKNGDKSLLQQAFEALDRAIAIVEAPTIKVAALATAIKTLIDFFQAAPK